MSEPAYRPEAVVAAMAALGLSTALRDAFYEATEDYAVLSIKQMNEGMRAAGLSVADRLAVKTQLGGGPAATPPPPPPALTDHQEVWRSCSHSGPLCAKRVDRGIVVHHPGILDCVTLFVFVLSCT